MNTCSERVCDLNDTWEDALDAFARTIQGESAWSCHCVDDVDKEVILSAPEIMDPKTDAGYGYENIYSLEHLLHSGQISLTATVSSPEAMIDLMDFIFMKELSYLRGYSVIHSFLTFPYFLCLDELRNVSPSLHAYCRGVLRGVDCVVRAVYATTIRSDEEFMLIPPELDRQLESPVEELLAGLDRAIADTHAPHDATPRNDDASADTRANESGDHGDDDNHMTDDGAMKKDGEGNDCRTRLAARLRLRRMYVQALHLFLEAKSRREVEAACTLCEELVALLDSAAFHRESEPVVSDSLQRGKEAAYWVSIFTPPSPPPPLSFAESMQMYRVMFTQLASLRSLFAFRSLQGITEFVEQLGAQQPMLPTRALAVVVLFSRDPNESFLYGLPLHQRILQVMAHDYGSPLYLRLFEGDQATVDSVVRYRMHRSMDIRKITPENVKNLRTHTVDTVHGWTADACKHYLLHLETMLCNRGLAHRRLMNTISDLCKWEIYSTMADSTVFAAYSPSISSVNNENNDTYTKPKAGTDLNEDKHQMIRCSKVLTLYAHAALLRCMELIVQLYIELDLLTQGELLPSLWYVNILQLAQMDNMSLLCLQSTSFIPELRLQPKTRVPMHNMAIATRVAGVPDELTSAVWETSRMVSDIAFLSGCMMESQGLIDLSSAPRHALITTAEVFNHRIFKCFGCIQTAPVSSYTDYMAANTKLGVAKGNADADERRLFYAKQGRVVAAKAAENARLLLQKLTQLSTMQQPSATEEEHPMAGAAETRLRLSSLRPTLEALEQSANALTTSMACFEAATEDPVLITEYTAQVEKLAGGTFFGLPCTRRRRRHAWSKCL